MFGVFIFTVCFGIKNMLKSGSRADFVYNLYSWGTWSFKSKISDFPPQY